MREHPRLFQSPGEAPPLWLKLASKAEVNELFREWKAAHVACQPEERCLGCLGCLAANIEFVQSSMTNWDRATGPMALLCVRFADKPDRDDPGYKRLRRWLGATLPRKERLFRRRGILLEGR
jgi:hypothetical protein